jgi:hypothetical protein
VKNHYKTMESDPDKSRPHKKRLNCWEVMMCGREQGGKNIAEYGVCDNPEAGIKRAAQAIDSGEALLRLQGLAQQTEKK